MIYIILILLIAANIFFWVKINKSNDTGVWFGIGMFSNIWMSTLLLTFITFLFVNFTEQKVFASQYPIIKQTIENSRESATTEFERASLTVKIIVVNEELASLKYWNNTILDGAYLDEVANLEYLK